MSGEIAGKIRVNVPKNVNREPISGKIRVMRWRDIAGSGVPRWYNTLKCLMWWGSLHCDVFVASFANCLRPAYTSELFRSYHALLLS